MSDRTRIIAVALLAVAHSTGSFSQSPPVAADEVGAPQPGKALIYLMRTNQMVNKAVVDEVTLDGVSWGTLPAGSYLIAQIDAGPHEISIGGPRHRKKYVETRQLQVAAGRVLYLMRSHGMRGAATAFVDRAWAEEFLSTHGPSPGNRLAAGLPLIGSKEIAVAAGTAAPGESARDAWAGAGRWAQVGILISSEKTQEAIALASRTLLESPDDPQGYFLRGLAYFMQGDADLAEASFDRAIELAPEHGEALAYRGFTREQADRLDAAEADLSAALALGVETTSLYMDRLQGPWTTSVPRRRAAVRVKLGRAEAALDDLERAMALERDNPFLYLDRARAQLAAGRLEAAYDDAVTLAGLLPQMPWASDIMGQVRWWQGDYAQAIRLYERGLEQTATEEGRAGAGRGAILARLAMAERLNGESAEAMRHLEEAIQLEQESPKPADYVLLGTLLHEAGRGVEAAGAFRRAAGLDPELVTQLSGAEIPAGADPRSLAFLEHQRGLAASYLGGGGAPAALPGRPSAPRATIHDVTVEPSPVAAGEAFDFVIDYTVDDPAMSAGPVPLRLVVEIVRDGTVVFTAPAEDLSATNGSRATWVQHMNPTTAVGGYSVRVLVACRGAEATAEASFRIE
jgi:tetratricopeptide (TPR) repeat protein